MHGNHKCNNKNLNPVNTAEMHACRHASDGRHLHLFETHLSVKEILIQKLDCHYFLVHIFLQQFKSSVHRNIFMLTICTLLNLVNYVFFSLQFSFKCQQYCWMRLTADIQRCALVTADITSSRASRFTSQISLFLQCCVK